MKYQCSGGHIFTFPVTVHTAAGESWVETKTCPYCIAENTHIDEYVEPQESVTSVKSVDLAQVDDYLKQGYVVRELYAKTATLVKLEVKA